jgi:ribonuclease HI
MSNCVPHQQHFWFMDPQFNLYRSMDKMEWFKYQSTHSSIASRHRRSFQFRLSYPSACVAPPSPLYRASVQQISPNIVRVEMPPLSHEPVATPSPNNAQNATTFQQWLTVEPFYEFLYPQIDLTTENELAIVSAIRGGSLMVCSDGSFNPHTKAASYGMIFATIDSHLLKLPGPCPGTPYHMSPIRAELTSITAAIYFLLVICSTHNVSTGSVTLYNDSTKAIKYINNPGQKFKRFLMDDYDLLAEIWASIHALKKCATFNLVWVNGHFRGENKEPQHYLNEEAHKLASSALTSPTNHSADIPPPSLLVDLHCGHILTSKWQAFIQEAVHSTPLCATICKSTKWMKDQFDTVDWETLCNCLRKLC